jgi:hypothetical protein
VPWKRAKFYGIETIKKVAMNLPTTNFILARYKPKKGKIKKPFPNCSIYPLLDLKGMFRLYKASFCSIRPTRHDGFPQSIAELGLMGRKTGWIYDSNLAVKCRSVSDYVRFIQQEKKAVSPSQGSRKMFLKIAENTPKILENYENTAG